MNQSNTKKLAIAGILCAVAVVGSLFTFPVLASKCAPIQHMVNVLCAVLLGPWYGVGVAFGASLAGKRSFCAMKHVGLNVAADPLFTVAYTGVNAGMVIAVADDPGMHSSQNEQDSRHYAIAAKLPMLEPADSAEALAFTRRA